MAEYIRARSPEHKLERKEAIMTAADTLFLALPYHEITLALIAHEVGLSRANLYKYAKSKEEIYLSVHAKYNEAYFVDLEKSLGQAPLSDEEFARIWARVTARHCDFLKYQDVLISILESNVTLECLTQFKRNFARISAPVDALLARQCGIDDARAHELYRCLLYQASGMRNLYQCADLTREAMAAAGLDPITGTFEEAYASFTLMCLEWYARHSSE